MRNMETASKPLADDKLEIRSVGDESLVHDPAKGKVHVLNLTAAKILKLCDGNHTHDDIAKALCDETGADATQVGADVDRIVEQFRGLGLVR